VVPPQEESAAAPAPEPPPPQQQQQPAEEVHAQEQQQQQSPQPRAANGVDVHVHDPPAASAGNDQQAGGWVASSIDSPAPPKPAPLSNIKFSLKL
jgi:hypothetical protein